MILTEKTYEGVVSNVKNDNWQFMMEANAKAFETLSSSLYQDKKGSIVRELSCNALDSHIEAGKPDEPFHVHLPSVMEPYFGVKDFGIGMDEDTIKKVFTVLFASTKDQSNNTVGAFGLGAKTPFSYTDSFTVVSCKDGIETSYAMYKDDNGLPICSKMGSKQTSNPNGVEIIIPINDQYDRSAFRAAVVEQLKFFKVRPVITGGDYDVVWPEAPKSIAATHGNVEIYYDGNTTYSGLYAVMGPVGYQINLDILSKQFPKHADLLSHLKYQSGTFIKFCFNIGEVSVAPSRETLTYDKRTFAAFEKSLDGLHESLSKSFFDGMDACTTVKERIQFVITNYQKMRSLVGKVDITKYDFGIWTPNLYGNVTFNITAQTLSDKLNSPLSLYAARNFNKRYGASAAFSSQCKLVIADSCKFAKRRVDAIIDTYNTVVIETAKVNELIQILDENELTYTLLSEIEPVKSDKNYSYLTTEGYLLNVHYIIGTYSLLRDMGSAVAKRITDKNEIEPGFYLSSHRGEVDCKEKLEKYTQFKAAGLITDSVKDVYAFPRKSAEKLKNDEEWTSFEDYLNTFDFEQIKKDNAEFHKKCQALSIATTTLNNVIPSYIINYYDLNSIVEEFKKDIAGDDYEKIMSMTNIAAMSSIYQYDKSTISNKLARYFRKIYELIGENYPILKIVNPYYVSESVQSLNEYMELVDNLRGKVDISELTDADALKKLLD